MRIRLLVCDIDGTLLSSSSQLSERTRQAVRAAAAAGCQVTLATGRRFHSAKGIADSLGLELPLIVHNGALIRDSLTRAVLFQRRLSPEAARAATEHFWHGLAQPIIYESVKNDDDYGERVIAGPEQRDSAHNRAYLTRNAAIRMDSLEALLGVSAPLEVAALESAARTSRLAEGLVHPHLRHFTSPSGPGTAMVEVIAADVSKATALRLLAQRLQAPLEQTMAIGDNVNDVELLQTAGLSVAMANGHADAIAAATHLTLSNDEDGVAAAIEQFVLQRTLARE